MAERDPMGPAVHPDRLTSPAAAPPSEESRARALEQRLGYCFKNRALLQEALTHGSATGRSRRAPRSNERLEFLGDRVLGLVAAELLIRRFPDAPEGALTPRFHALVTGPALSELAHAIGLGEALILSAGEGEEGRRRPAILADACEAVIGAVHLDGGFEEAQAIVRRLLRPRLDAVLEVPREPKSSLQEWAQARALPLPAYTEVRREGPAHAPEFEIEVRLEGHPPARATGSSKRAAEQAAALALLRALETPDG